MKRNYLGKVVDWHPSTGAVTEAIRIKLGNKCAFENTRCSARLAIHHIEGNGKERRELHGGTTYTYYAEILEDIKQGKGGYKLLCYRCHGKEHGGSCG